MSQHDDEVVFRPKMGKRQRPASDSGATTFRNAVMKRVGRARWISAGAQRRAPRSRASPTTRRVIVKVHTVRMTKYGAKAAKLHLRYIQRDGVERDGARGLLYGADGPVKAEDCARELKGETHQYRLIISPEEGGELDMQRYVREYMKRIDHGIGRKLDWYGINHYNTEHPHTHVVVRGVDRDGQRLHLDRELIRHGLREIAQKLATEELGPRLEMDVKRTREKEIVQERFTSIDRQIERKTQGLRLDLPTPPGVRGENLLTRRVRQLEQFGLAARDGPTSWTLTDGWQKTLRDIGARRDIINEMHRAIGGKFTGYRIVEPGRALEVEGDKKVITGRVVAKGLFDELKGTMYAIVETPSGGGVHVRLDAYAMEKCRVGSVVAIGARSDSPRQLWVRPEPLGIKEQVTHRGLTWLDQLEPKTLALHGLGAELRHALEKRDEFLRSLGINRDDPHRLTKLRGLERKLDKGITR